MKIDLKPTCPMNPKDIIGSSKLPLELVPDTAVAYMALAFLEGALKYGRYNWRVAGVRSSIYVSAARRHMARFWNGEDSDPKTLIPHLASVMACCAIILDASECDKLVDDRPPAAPVGHLTDLLAVGVERLKVLFADHSPRQWTIADSVATGDAGEPLECACDECSVHDDPTDAAYEAAAGFVPAVNDTRAVAKTYSVSPAAGVTLGPYSSQEALDKALYRWANYREILGETEDQREARLRREQDQ